ncbi:MAG: glycosyltransferase family 4 protein [Patescibacteria group bacterium]
MKKILTIIYDLDKGGTQRAAQVFATAYQKNGYDSRVLSLYGLGSRSAEMRGNIQIWDGITDKNIEEIKVWRPDIIHLHSHGLKETDVNKVFDVFKKNDVKVVEQNVFSTPSPWASRVDVSFQFSWWALWLYNLRGGRRSKAAIVPNPVICENFYPRSHAEIKTFKDAYGIPGEAFVIGRIGQSCPGKWSIMLIDSFNKLAKDHKKLFLVVVNPPDNILEEITKSPFKERVIHIPILYGDNGLSIAYSSFDLMIHTAEIGESFGYVLAESILCGTPVITLSTPWGDNSQCEVVGNLRGGYVVNSSKGIVTAVEHYLTSDSKNKMKKSGRDYIYEKYNYLEVANQAISSLSDIDRNFSKIVVSDKINTIAKDTFDKTNLLTVLLLKTNSLFFRRLTAYQYPTKILCKKIFNKLFRKSII